MNTRKPEIWLDKAGRRRRLTPLQDKVAYWMFDHPSAPQSECARALKCSYTAVTKTTHNPLYQAKLAEIRGMVDQLHVMQRQEAEELLTTFARTDITEVVDVDGTPDMSHKQPAISGYSVSPGKYGTSRKVTLESKRESIELLGQLQGWLRDEKQVNIGSIGSITINVKREDLTLVVSDGKTLK